MPRNETLLNPKEKPQEEKNSCSWARGFSLHIAACVAVLFTLKARREGLPGWYCFSSPQRPPSDGKECGPRDVGSVLWLRPERGGRQSGPRGAADVSPRGAWVHWGPEAAILESRTGSPGDRTHPAGGEVGRGGCRGCPRRQKVWEGVAGTSTEAPVLCSSSVVGPPIFYPGDL